MSFSSFNLHPELLRAVDALGFIVPTPIQKDAIPPACRGRDVLACAMTGSGADVLVATPGRLLDHFQHPYARLDALETLVIDEADRMLDMGFLPDIRRVLKALPARRRQTLLFSATLPAAIIDLARELLLD